MKVKCAICGKELNQINFLHLRVHGLTTSEYRALYPNVPLYSDELKEVRSDQMLNSNPMNDPEYREKISIANNNPSEENRRKMSENNTMHNPEHRKKVSDALTGREFSNEHKKNLSIAMKIASNNEETRKINSDIHKKLWENPEFVKRWMKANNKRPNKSETCLNSILQVLVPDEYKYNGDFECGVSLEQKIPDFVNVNGKKKVIELYGDYWHDDDDPEDRIALFKRYGYDTLVIWEHELNNSQKLMVIYSPEERGIKVYVNYVDGGFTMVDTK